MIGYQILAAEQPDGTFICDKVGALSIELSMAHAWNNKEEAERIYNTFGTEDSEFTLDRDELSKIAQSRTCIEGNEGYHKLACDGIVVIPVTKDKFLNFKEFDAGESEHKRPEIKKIEEKKIFKFNEFKKQ